MQTKTIALKDLYISMKNGNFNIRKPTSHDNYIFPDYSELPPGPYHFYYIRGFILNTNIAKYKGPAILINRYRNVIIYEEGEFECCDQWLIIQFKDKYETKCVFTFLINNFKTVQDCYKGSAIKTLDKYKLGDIELTIPIKPDAKL